jgi:hypothetical protein
MSTVILQRGCGNGVASGENTSYHCPLLSLFPVLRRRFTLFSAEEPETTTTIAEGSGEVEVLVE